MGLPAPPPPVIGDTCDVCDGVLWPAGATPQFIHVTFEGIEACPLIPQDAPEGTYVLEQTDGDSCRWEYFDANYGLVVDVDVVGVITAQGLLCNGVLTFFYADFVECQSSYNNAYVECVPPEAGRFGTCKIVWS